MRQSPQNASCPICKACLSEDRIIPLYGRGRPEVDPRKDGSLRATISDELDAVPARPAAHRPPASPGTQSVNPQHEQQQQLRQRQQQQQQQQQLRAPAAGQHRRLPSWGIDNWHGGLLASGGGLLGLQLVLPGDLAAVAPPEEDDLTAEQAQQAFLSRLLLLLGSLVILCLLLF